MLSNLLKSTKRSLTNTRSRLNASAQKGSSMFLVNMTQRLERDDMDPDECKRETTFIGGTDNA